MKIRVKMKEVLEQMIISITILLGFSTYYIVKENWSAVWIILGVIVFMIFTVWIMSNALIDWMEKKKRR